MHKLKSTQKINTSPCSPKPRREVSNIFVGTEKNGNGSVEHTKVFIMKINSFIYLSEKVSQKNQS